LVTIKMVRSSKVVLMSDYPDGSIEILDAPEEILVADAFLADMESHPAYSYGDGILTVHACNGDLSYGLHDYDSARRVWHGTRAGASLDRDKCRRIYQT
jgi:hypothetical protein